MKSRAGAVVEIKRTCLLALLALHVSWPGSIAIFSADAVLSECFFIGGWPSNGVLLVPSLECCAVSLDCLMLLRWWGWCDAKYMWIR